MSQDFRFPIRRVAELTGVPTVTLRAWERRYGLLKPMRTAKGHRQYSGEDVDLINKIVLLLKQNHTISEAVRLVRQSESDTIEPVVDESHWQAYQQRILQAVEAFDMQNLDKVYNDALALYPIDMVTEHVVIPVLTTLGEQWQTRDSGIAEEHCFSSYLRNKLGTRLHHEALRSRGSKLLVACLPDEHHELGVLLFSIAALGRGYRILYLGPNMPVNQIPAVVKKTNVSAVLVSGSQTFQWTDELGQELASCKKKIKMPLMVGGFVSDRFRQQIEALNLTALGHDHVKGLDLLEETIPVFVA